MIRVDQARCTTCAHRVLADPPSCGCYCHAVGFDVHSVAGVPPIRTGRSVPARTPDSPTSGPGRDHQVALPPLFHLLIATAGVMGLTIWLGAGRWQTPGDTLLAAVVGLGCVVWAGRIAHNQKGDR